MLGPGSQLCSRLHPVQNGGRGPKCVSKKHTQSFTEKPLEIIGRVCRRHEENQENENTNKTKKQKNITMINFQEVNRVVSQDNVNNGY